MSGTDLFMQAAGFLLQSLPAAFLCFIPFRDSELKAPRRTLFLLLSAALVLLSFGFAGLTNFLFHPDNTQVQTLRSASNFYMSLCLMAGAAVFLVSVRANRAKKILVLMLTVHYCAVVYTLESFFHGWLAQERSAQVFLPYDAVDLFYYLFMLCLTYPLLWLFLRRIVRSVLPAMEEQSMRRAAAYLVCALLLYCLCVFALTNFRYYYGLSGLPAAAFLTAFVLTDALLYYMFFHEATLSLRMLNFERQLRSFDEKYGGILANIEESRRARHDIRHHLNIIGMLNREGKQAELTEYLRQYEVFCEELEPREFSGWPSLDNLLLYYMELAENSRISVETDILPFSRRPALDVIDLSIMIGNLMENALESCRQSGVQNYIRIWIRLTDASLLIYIENSCPTDVPDTHGFTDGSHLLSGKLASGHGYGLKSIRHIAEKYGGSAEFSKNGDHFTSRIVLNTTTPPPKNI